MEYLRIGMKKLRNAIFKSTRAPELPEPQNLSRTMKYMVAIHKILSWQSPLNTLLVFLAVNFLFCLAIYTEQKPFAVLFYILLILHIMDHYLDSTFFFNNLKKNDLDIFDEFKANVHNLYQHMMNYRAKIPHLFFINTFMISTICLFIELEFGETVCLYLIIILVFFGLFIQKTVLKYQPNNSDFLISGISSMPSHLEVDNDLENNSEEEKINMYHPQIEDFSSQQIPSTSSSEPEHEQIIFGSSQHPQEVEQQQQVMDFDLHHFDSTSSSDDENLNLYPAESLMPSITKIDSQLNEEDENQRAIGEYLKMFSMKVITDVSSAVGGVITYSPLSPASSSRREDIENVRRTLSTSSDSDFEIINSDEALSE